MPARRVVYGDTGGMTAFQDAALVPVRRARDWNGWMTMSPSRVFPIMGLLGSE